MSAYGPNPSNSGVALIGCAVAMLVVGAIGLLMWGGPVYSRYQARADANNVVQLNMIEIQQQAQRIQIVQQQAQQRVAEAYGIAKSQAIIAGSLTPAYLQYLAIAAQKEAAQNSSHTESIYIPSTWQGVPVVPVTTGPGRL